MDTEKSPHEQEHSRVRKAKDWDGCLFDIIGNAEIREIVEYLPDFLCANLRETCTRVWKAIPAPKKMGVNMLLRAGAKKGSLEICEYARKRGAIAFGAMLEDAAYYGHLDICAVALEWFIEFCKSRGLDKKEMYGVTQLDLHRHEVLIDGMCSAARGVRKEVFKCLANLLSPGSIFDRSWIKLIESACLSGNSEWCMEILHSVPPEYNLKFYKDELLGGAYFNMKICDFVFEKTDDCRYFGGYEPSPFPKRHYSLQAKYHKVIEYGNIEMCEYWRKKMLESGRQIDFDEAMSFVCKSGKIELVKMVKNWAPPDYIPSFKAIGMFASVGWFNLCREEIARIEMQRLSVSWFDIAEYAVSYPGESEFCDSLIDYLVQFRSRIESESVLCYIWGGLKSRNIPRIKRLVGLYSEQHPLSLGLRLFKMSSTFGEMFEEFEVILPFLGSIFPNFTTEDIMGNFAREISLEMSNCMSSYKLLRPRNRVHSDKFFEYCKRVNICPEFCKNYAQIALYFGEPEEYMCHSTEVPLV